MREGGGVPLSPKKIELSVSIKRGGSGNQWWGGTSRAPARRHFSLRGPNKQPFLQDRDNMEEEQGKRVRMPVPSSVSWIDFIEE